MLRPEEMARRLTFLECAPAPAAEQWVERVWSVTWDLPLGSEYVSSVLPHPSVHLTVERGEVERHGAHGPGVWLTGVVTARFDAVCRGRGGVVGVKLHPGAYAALTGRSARSLRERAVHAADLLAGTEALADLPLDAHRSAAELSAYVTGLARPDDGYDRLRAVLAHLEDPGVQRVDELAARSGLSVRGLQRLTDHYVGVGPKWLVLRRRMHDAVRALDGGADVAIADVAARFGWYDQSQFARDFVALLGQTPVAYRDRAAQDASDRAG
ncbi:helix-turn-helix domain-containing protein [Alteromonas gracilis]